MILIPMNKDDNDQSPRVYMIFKTSTIPYTERLRSVLRDASMLPPSLIPPLESLSPLERLEWFARIGADRTPDDPMPPGFYHLMISLSDNINEQRWFCHHRYHKRAHENLKRPLDEIEALPLCNLLEALLYLVRWERHDGFWGTILGKAWNTGVIQALARGVKNRLEKGERPVRSKWGW